MTGLTIILDRHIPVVMTAQLLLRVNDTFLILSKVKFDDNWLSYRKRLNDIKYEVLDVNL